MRIRSAQLRDLGIVRKLWAEFLAEEEKAGGVIKATQRNLDFYIELAKAYITGSLKGTVLLHAEDAVLIWGETPSQSSIDLAINAGQAWGIYVSPKQRQSGIAEKMYSYARNDLCKLGIDYVSGLIRIDNYSSMALAKSLNAETILNFVVAKLRK